MMILIEKLTLREAIKKELQNFGVSGATKLFIEFNIRHVIGGGMGVMSDEVIKVLVQKSFLDLWTWTVSLF